MHIYSTTQEGFDIDFYALEESLTLEDTFDDSVTDLEELAEHINSGELVYFCAKVTASKNGIELASDYLGACCYKSYMQFVEYNDYFADMVNTVVGEAEEAINKLVS